ncbi:low temperature requirement protein A [Streptococcus pluranimalium]|uniref:Low temperature requirement protein A n=1 Tax=Streptococcus pluranimalium TaxID=82348 RepID=A0A2L0D1Y7_9STRE|nr:low temperature requirement protein A [Streptococcus pluranimalium]AUW95806.1 low temperature requirement protein A [Streptococcus pluranimalium]
MHKKVSIPELFFDLVYVYAIGRSMTLIHHLQDGFIPLGDFIIFTLSFLFLINIWVYQTVFLNRYGTESIKNHAFLFLDMGLLLLLSNSFSLEWQGQFTPFVILVLLLTASLFSQYFLALKEHKSPEHQELIKNYLLILGVRFALVLLSLFMSLTFGIYFYLAGFLAGLMLPLFFQKDTSRVPISFAHLVERLTLLVIITFGEMIMGGIAKYFTLVTFSFQSILFFIIVLSLFWFYYEEFYVDINHDNPHTTGMRMIYLHYVIFLSLTMVTAALSFLTEPDVNNLFVVIFLFVALGMYYFSIVLHNTYNKASRHLSDRFLKRILLIYLLSLAGSLIFSGQHLLVTFIVTGLTASLAYLFHQMGN